MSTLINALSVPNMASASAFDSSVFPTPVGPKNRNEPMGLPGSCKPTLPLLMALETALTAAFWPITRLCSTLSSRSSRSLSFSVSFFTGTFVQEETTSAISFSLTARLLSVCCLRLRSRALS